LFLYNDSLFQDLYALSPSLWIDDYHLLQYESQRGSQFEEFQKNYWVSCGSAEKLNRIVGGVKRFSDSLERRNYPTVRHRATIYKGKTHNSSVGPALEDIFTSFTDGGDVFH
jgi:predicted alpha/beta superfamily hydrolase